VKLLVLGGPRFLGRALADAALARGHELTLFNRGRTNPELYPEAERLVGDRSSDLSGLAGREWDAVVDTCGYLPDDVRASAEALAGSGLYSFVSSVSVYADFSAPLDEDSPVAELGDLPRDEVTNETYGALKALCENAVRDVFAERALVVRPGLITGPHDPTGRFTYWPHRVARGGELLAPGPPERDAQFVDVRDLAAWILDATEARLTGPFNVTSEPYTFADVVAGADVTWVDDGFLLEREVGEWMELPLWIAETPGQERFHQVDTTKAHAAGLRHRPLAETIEATLAEAKTVDGVGLAAEREAELLRDWHDRNAR